MFVYVEDKKGKTHLLNTDHVIKCVQRTEKDYWNIHMADDTDVNVLNEDFQAFALAIKELIGG